jgi:hypothetical protein
MSLMPFLFATQPSSHNYMFTDSSKISIPLTSTARQQAQQFAQAQANPTKQQQVYRNTLAVQAVNTYLQWMEVNTDLDRSWSQHPGKQFCFDVADLYLPGIGRLECRPVLPNQATFEIPIEAQAHRMGYVAVEIDQTGQAANLLGFTQQSSSTEIRIAQLDHLDSLLMALEPMPVRLGNWLQQQFDSHWVSLQSLTMPTPLVACLPLNVLSPAADRSLEIERLLQQLANATDEETRWKTIEKLWTIDPEHPATGVRRVVDLGLYLGGEKVALMMAILPNPDQSLSILLRAYPMGQPCLNTGLALAGLYESGAAFIEAESRAEDNYIQVKFLADPGERFGVRVCQGDAEFIEQFVV